MTKIFDSRGWKDSEYEAKGQLENFRVLMEVANAIRYGRTGSIRADPRVIVNAEEAEARMRLIEEEWTVEWRGRGKPWESPCPKFTALPLNAKLYLHSRLKPNQSPTVKSEPIPMDAYDNYSEF
jgi:hypothetical protein